MQITVETNSQEISDHLRFLYQDQMPFAVSRAINQTLREIQKGVRSDISDRFTLRRRQWAMMNVKIRREDFATKTKKEGAVRMEAPPSATGDRSDILAKFEERVVKRPGGGGRIAIPREVKQSRLTVVRTDRKPKSYNFTHVSGAVWKGNRRTFMIRQADGRGGVFQRTGRKRSGRREASDIGTRRTRDMNVRVLFLFTPRAQLDKRLSFEEIATKTAGDSFERNFVQSFENSMVNARLPRFLR